MNKVGQIVTIITEIMSHQINQGELMFLFNIAFSVSNKVLLGINVYYTQFRK